MNSRRVLICAAETGVAFGMAACLRRRGGRNLWLVTGDSNRADRVTASLLADRHVQMPPLDDPGFPDNLARVIADEGITDYIPLQDREFGPAEDIRRHFPSVSVWSPPLAAHLAQDKRATRDWLVGLDLPVPRIFTIETLPEQGDVFVKPRLGYGGRGAGLVPVDMVRRMPAASLEPLILQEVCRGPEVTVDSFYDAATRTGRAIVRERLAVRLGVCVTARIYEDRLLASYARRIGAALGQRGTICFQCMRNSDGWVITDVNHRPGAGSPMTVAAGIDILGAAVACRWGEDYRPLLERVLPDPGVHVTRQYAEYVMS